ncbi:alpha-1-acid glycoprotein 1 [Sarotherodon galilaeus]
MIEHKLFNISLFLLLLFSGDLSGDLSLSFTVRDGDKVTLPCENVINNHHSCHTTTWLFTDSRGKAAVELVNLGQIKETVKSDRLSVTAECSLVIKKVTAEDVGRYTCRQFRGNPGRQQGPDAVVHLSDVIMTEQKSRDQVTLNCSVQVHGHCEHKVKWIHYSEALNRDYSNIKTLQSSCSATVTFVNSLYSHISNSDFKCNVTTEDDKEQLFTFSPHSSGEETITTTTVKLEITIENTMRAGLATKELESIEGSRKLQNWSWYRLIIVSLGLAALIAAVVIVNIWIRVGEKAQMDENTMCKDEDDDGAVNYENVQSSDEV